MENLIFEVKFYKELYVKFLRVQSAQNRKKIIGLAIFTGLLAVALIVGDILSDSIQTKGAGAFFAILCGVFLFTLKRLSTKSIAKTIEKNSEFYPQKYLYTFLDDKYIVEMDSQTSHTHAEHSYSSISKVYQIDEKMLFILLKTNSFYSIESDRVGEIVSFLSTKVAKECFEKSIDKQVNLVALFLCIIGGYSGFHQFYYKNIKMGILYLVTGGLFCFGAIIDLIRILQCKKPIGCKSKE